MVLSLLGWNNNAIAHNTDSNHLYEYYDHTNDSNHLYDYYDHTNDSNHLYDYYDQ